MNVKKVVADKIKQLGDDAPAYFGKKASTLAIWNKTKKFPLAAIQKVLDDQPSQTGEAPIPPIEPDRGPPQAERQAPSAVMAHRPDPANPPKAQEAPAQTPEPEPPPISVTLDQRMQVAEQNINATANFINTQVNPKLAEGQSFLEQISQRLAQVEALLQPSVQVPTVGQALQNGEMAQHVPSTVRPAQTTGNVVNYGTYTAPAMQPAAQSRHFLDTGIAPSKEQVDAQQGNQAVNMPPGQTANRLAGPALQEPMPLNPGR